MSAALLRLAGSPLDDRAHAWWCSQAPGCVTHAPAPGGGGGGAGDCAVNVSPSVGASAARDRLSRVAERPPAGRRPPLTGRAGTEPDRPVCHPAHVDQASRACPVPLETVLVGGVSTGEAAVTGRQLVANGAVFLGTAHLLLLRRPLWRTCWVLR